MTLQRAIIYITGIFIAVGFAESQAQTPDPQPCGLAIEINALRGGSPTVTVEGTKDITAKARILKGTAQKGTTIDTTLTIDAFDDGSEPINSQSVPVRLEVGKGGQGKKLTMNILECDSGSIKFVATFSGYDENDALCESTRAMEPKTCK
jgi:hypothetical protein